MAENILHAPIRRTGTHGESLAISLPGISSWVWFVAVIVAGAALRFIGIAWDETYHLHPDERFLTMVETAIRAPANLGGYFDTATSTLSPYNNNFGLYVYGTFPLYLVKAVGQALTMADYDKINLVGRALSALFDVGTIAATIVVGRRLYGPAVGLLGGGLYALMALPIQQAHFFTVDSYATFFAVLAAYLALRIGSGNGSWDYALLGLAVGFGVACKISMFVLGGFAVLGAGLVLYRIYERDGIVSWPTLQSIGRRLVLAGIVAILTFRVLQPIAFQGPTILNFTPNQQWLNNMAEISGLQSGERDFPPGHQWTNRPAVWFPWSNMVLWGMGLPLGLAAWVGWGLASVELIRRRKIQHLVPVVFIGAVFLYQGTQWVKSMRYFLHIYPFLAIMAAYLLHRLWITAQPARGKEIVSTLLRAGVIGIVGLTLLYAVGFVSIYTRPHSRVEASRWIFDNVPRGAAIANEHWDDPLPLRVDGRDGFGGYYRGLMLNNYDDDTPKKLEELVTNLVQADYVVLSSNRLYDSIPRLPTRYPMTTRYYELLLSEQLGFRRVAQFTSYPSLLGIALPDQSAEEAWTVYDHPKVTIFQKTSDFDRDQVRRQLGDGIDWEGILRLRPDQATKARNGLLLSSADLAVYQTSGTWRTVFSPDGLSNRLPILAWWLALEALGLAALPITMSACRSLVDSGWGVSKPLGLLLVGWLAWIIASLHLVQFGRGLIVGSLAFVLIASALVLLIRGREVQRLIRAQWRLIALEEALFGAAFLVFLAVRASNPDIWHPVMGGEKPMDFAYLNAVIKSAYFPPYDPWFAGGYINYYYFGFVLVAALVHLTGVVPWVAYNLAVPTFFAATVAGAFTVALNLVQPQSGGAPRGINRFDRPSRAAVAAGLFAAIGVAIIGNLGELQLILKGLFEVGRTTIQLPIITGALRILDGLHAVIGGGRTLPFRTEWWYWNATRVIEHPSTEAGPITEFPYFTFLYGDLHAHSMGLPFTLVCLALGIGVLRSAPASQTVRRGVRSWAFPWLACGLLALVLGALWPLNTWDFPTFAVLSGAALAWRSLALKGRWSPGALIRAGAQWLGIVALAYALFLPFHQTYAAAYSSVELWQGSRTGLDAYLIIHGIFLFVIVTGLILRIAARGTRAPLVREIRLLARQLYRPIRLIELNRLLVRRGATQRIGLGLLASSVLVACGLFAAKGIGVSASLATLGVPLVVLALTGVLFFDSTLEARQRFTLTCIALGAALTMFVEVIVLKGDISRMNTVFKFYLQVWTLWSVAAASMLPELLDGGHEASGAAWSARRLKLPELPGWWRPAFAALVLAGLLYPIFATYVRAQDRFENSSQLTLDGMAYMDEAIYSDKDQAMTLRWDRDAIRWLLANVNGSPVIAEAVTPLYHWGSRVSVYTGLPTIIGWDWHQKQQRAILPGEVVDRRIVDVGQIFGAATADRTRELLDRYHVRYLYVGQQERLYYPGVEVKMRAYDGSLWNRVYENQEVTIYEVRSF
ncbi:MAG TPA: DUF2298 domain-containing protein [Chloroflexota bacterium]|nr:DUF2298 domain-containing protein [Chloroflexota bacterium]